MIRDSSSLAGCAAGPLGGEQYELAAGGFCYYPPGVEDVWEIVETYVKIHGIHSEPPLPF